MSRRDETPRDLLFGLLALQVGLIDQEQLIVAFGAWSRAKGRTLAEILIERGSIDEESRSLLAGMAEKQLKLHGGDAEKSLAAVAAGPATLEKLVTSSDTDLTGSVHLVASPTCSEDASATMSLGSPTTKGQRFRVLRPHAQGGLGAVFVALDGELNREVALKQILDKLADDPTSRTRFLIEAEITGGLEHPGIVPVYGLGHYVDGRPYYAMRFIRGDSFKEAIASFHSDESLKRDAGKRSLALRKLLRRFVDVCNAIDYAHGRGVLHRDLKPANVIVGKYGETLVVDWGLAKLMGHSEVGKQPDERTLMPSSSSGSAETLPGFALGTPAYMSPEQAAGDLEKLGPRSDVYSLGATLYCLLTGRAPFEGNDLGVILRAVRKGEFPSPATIEPSVDPPLQVICLKAMANQPGDRYPSAKALADDVDRWSADEPVSAYRDPLQVRMSRWARRHRLGVAIGVGLLQTAVVVLAVSTILLGQSRERIERERSRSSALNDFLVKDLLAQADPENNPVGDRITVRELLDKAAASIDKSPSLKGREDVEGGIRAAIGNVFYSLGLYPDSERHLARAVECLEKSAASVPPVQWIAVRNKYLWTLYKEYKYDGLMKQMRENLEEAEKILGPEHELTIFAADNLAAITLNQGSPDGAILAYRKNLEIQRRLYGPDHKLTQIAAGNLASALLNQPNPGSRQTPDDEKKYAEAESLAHATCEAAIRTQGSDSVEALRNATYEARAMIYLEKYAEAANLLGPLKERFVRVFGLENVNMAAALFQLGLAEEGLGHIEAAEPLLAKAHQVTRDARDPTKYETRVILWSLIRVTFTLGKFKEAAALGRELIATSVRPELSTDPIPSVEALSVMLAGEGEPAIIRLALTRLLGSTGRAASERDWLRVYLNTVQVEYKIHDGTLEEGLVGLGPWFDLLETNKNTPARYLAEARKRVERYGRDRPTPAAGVHVKKVP